MTDARQDVETCDLWLGIGTGECHAEHAVCVSRRLGPLSRFQLGWVTGTSGEHASAQYEDGLGRGQ